MQTKASALSACETHTSLALQHSIAVCLIVGIKAARSDWLNPEVEPNQAEDEALQILNKVIEHPQPLRVLGGLHIRERPYLRGGERDMFLATHHLQFLSPNAVRGWPMIVVLPC